jgi:predicted regulator of Ras-like GTPase activity (Roadblock/LC7/MglB family)
LTKSSGADKTEAAMFQENLKRIVDGTDGAVAGLLMGFDGIAVDSYASPSSGMTLDIQNIGMEFSVILQQVRKAAESVEAGEVSELTIRTDRFVVVLRALTKDYFLALAIQPEGNFGKGRYLLRVIGPKMQTEL